MLQNEPNKFDGAERNMFKCILNNIIDSETNYVDWLNVLRQVCCLFFYI